MNQFALRDTWLMFQSEHGCSVDRMLCNPSLRAGFVRTARKIAECDDEETLLWGIVSLRKRKTLSSVLK